MPTNSWNVWELYIFIESKFSFCHIFSIHIFQLQIYEFYIYNVFNHYTSIQGYSRVYAKGKLLAHGYCGFEYLFALFADQFSSKMWSPKWKLKLYLITIYFRLIILPCPIQVILNRQNELVEQAASLEEKKMSNVSSQDPYSYQNLVKK